MEDLIAQFTFLSDQALCDKSFDPSAIDGLMKLFEVEAYKSWAAMELSCLEEAEKAQNSIDEVEDYLDSAMERAMEEFQRLEVQTERTSDTELSGLIQKGDAARKLGSTMEKAATVASDKHIGAATSSAVASMRSTLKSRPSSSSQKVHPY